MPATLRIDVTEKDIRLGHVKDPWSCPIARGGRRAARKKCVVGTKDVTIGHINVPLPKRAQRFIERFDAGLAVKPFSFTVRVKDGN